MQTAPIASGFKSHLFLPASKRNVLKGVSRTVVLQTLVFSCKWERVGLLEGKHFNSYLSHCNVWEKFSMLAELVAR